MSLFPPFGDVQMDRFLRESTPAERKALEIMFQVKEIRNPQQSEFVVSTSLYCKPHNPEEEPIRPLTLEELRRAHPGVRNGGSWWREYMEPLMRSLDSIPPPWTIRIHLAPDLVFLEPFIRHPKVEIRIMCHASEFTMPGMLWRYLPLDENGIVMARGADSMWPDKSVLPHIQEMLESASMLFRYFRPRDIDASGFFVYRPIPGPIVIKASSSLNYAMMAKAWLWHAMHCLLPPSVAWPFNGQPIPKFGMSHWARYGQDEQMLSHWLYYAAAAKGIYTVLPNSFQSHVWPFDQAYLLSECPLSRMVVI